jgi:hypothetical protein
MPTTPTHGAGQEKEAGAKRKAQFLTNHNHQTAKAKRLHPYAGDLHQTQPISLRTAVYSLSRFLSGIPASLIIGSGVRGALCQVSGRAVYSIVRSFFSSHEAIASHVS